MQHLIYLTFVIELLNPTLPQLWDPQQKKDMELLK